MLQTQLYKYHRRFSLSLVNSILNRKSVVCVLCLILFFAVTAALPVLEEDGLGVGVVGVSKHLHRRKRNLGQLINLIVDETPYAFYKLSYYGNWCGKGGDRMRDGSYVDGCDFCCKLHDQCYHLAKQKYPECAPLFSIYHYGPDKVGKRGGDSEESSHEVKHSRAPMCYPDKNDAPSCKQRICQCDVDFVMCLKKRPCPPEDVDKKSLVWFLG